MQRLSIHVNSSQACYPTQCFSEKINHVEKTNRQVAGENGGRYPLLFLASDQAQFYVSSLHVFSHATYLVTFDPFVTLQLTRAPPPPAFTTSVTSVFTTLAAATPGKPTKQKRSATVPSLPPQQKSKNTQSLLLTCTDPYTTTPISSNSSTNAHKSQTPSHQSRQQGKDNYTPAFFLTLSSPKKSCHNQSNQHTQGRDDDTDNENARNERKEKTHIQKPFLFQVIYTRNQRLHNQSPDPSPPPTSCRLERKEKPLDPSFARVSPRAVAQKPSPKNLVHTSPIFYILFNSPRDPPIS